MRSILRKLGPLFERTPGLQRRDIVLLILPAALWGASFSLRPHVITPHCLGLPTPCTEESVFTPDRAALGLSSGSADALSFTTQNGSGYLGLGLPIAWGTTLFALGRIHPAGWLLLVAANTVFFAQASLWNGFVTESIRITVQRPRPFVYADPQRYGNSPAHYTSFISGHTSFSAAAATSMVVLLARTGAPRALLYLGGSAGLVLVFLTGLFRVQAGRHFLTDVVAAAFIGTLVTLLLAYFTRARRLAD